MNGFDDPPGFLRSIGVVGYFDVVLAEPEKTVPPYTFVMSHYRRYRVPGGTYFFTVNLLERRRDLLVRHIAMVDAMGDYAH